MTVLPGLICWRLVACDIYTEWLWPDKEADWVVCQCFWMLDRNQILMLWLFQVEVMCSAQYYYSVVGASPKRRFIEMTPFLQGCRQEKDVITRGLWNLTWRRHFESQEGETIFVLHVKKRKAHIYQRINALIRFKDQYLIAGLQASS